MVAIRGMTVPGTDASTAAELDRGRDAFRRGAWEECYATLGAAAARGALEAADLDLLAECAQYTGRTQHCADILHRLHADHVAAGRVQAAALAAYRLHMLFALRGEDALAAGWLSRAARAVGQLPDCVESGYIRLAESERAYWRAETSESLAAARRARQLGERHADTDLVVVAGHLEGRALVRLHDVPEGLRLLDEAMVAAVAGELTPLYAVWVYCSSIITCHARADIRRAAEWTAAYERWSERYPAARMFSGPCHLHRGEIKQLKGAWVEAEQENRQAVELLSGLVAMDAAQASYHLAELHRLRGEYEAAEAAFAEAGRLGIEVQPGLSLLRLGQGRPDAAAAGLRRALSEPHRDVTARARLLPAFVEISLATGADAQAGAAAEELAAAATEIGTPALRALAAFSDGAVRLARGDAAGGLVSLRVADRLWQELDVPYERARTLRLIGLACRAVGDEDMATLDLAAGRRIFSDLGAAPDVVAMERLITGPGHLTASPPDGLTAREVEVLRLVASGATNRAVARQLHLSDRTVARHLSNIFAKTGLRSRAAATAYAFRNGLV